MSPQPLDHIWWLASRASRIVALILMTASVLIGLLLAAKIIKRPGASKALATGHQQLAVAALFGIALHGVTLLGDPFLRPGLEGIAVPFQAAHEPFFTGLGIVGGYLAAILGFSYWARRRIGSARWRNAHRWVVGAWLLSVVHTIGAGSDVGAPLVAYGIGASVATVAIMASVRVGAALARPAKPSPEAIAAAREKARAKKTGLSGGAGAHAGVRQVPTPASAP